MSVTSLLVNSTIKMSLVILLAFAAVALMRKRSAAFRHWLLAVVVGCAAMTPLLDAIRPSWPESLPRSEAIQTTGPAVPTITQARTPSPAPAPIRTNASANPAGLMSVFRTGGISSLLRTIWLTGLVASVFVLLAGLGRLKWLAGRSRRVTTGRWSELARETAGAYGLKRPFVLLQSDHPSLLVTWGFAAPRVILPAAAGEWSDARARVVLSHEIAHIRRGDWMVQMGVELLRAIFWFNPLLWVLSRRLRLESEQACDDEVMSRGVEAPDYATHLVDLARTLGRPPRFPRFPAPAMARPSSLERRVRAMLNDRLSRTPVRGSTRVLIVSALLVATVAIAAAQNLFSTLAGSIRDSQGAVLPNVTLVLSNSRKQTKYEIKSDPAGSFEFVGLQSGDYELEARMPGFVTLHQIVSVSGQNLARDLVLQVGSLEETVMVVDPEKYDGAAGAMRQTGSARAATACTPSPVGGNIELRRG